MVILNFSFFMSGSYDTFLRDLIYLVNNDIFYVRMSTKVRFFDYEKYFIIRSKTHFDNL